MCPRQLCTHTQPLGVGSRRVNSKKHLLLGDLILHTSATDFGNSVL